MGAIYGEPKQVQVVLTMLASGLMTEALRMNDSNVAEIARQMTSEQRHEVLEAVAVIEGVIKGIEGAAWPEIGEVDSLGHYALQPPEPEPEVTIEDVMEMNRHLTQAPPDVDAHRSVKTSRNPCDVAELAN